MRIATPRLARVWQVAKQSADTASKLQGSEKPPLPLSVFPPGLEPQPLPPSPVKAEQSPPFAPTDPGRAYEALAAFHGRRPCTVGLRRETGLPSFLYGELHPPVDSPIEEVSNFLRRNELMLSGLSEGAIQVRREGYYRWKGRVEQISFRQVNKAQVPIYGAHAVCTYSDRQLTFIGNTLFPAEPAQIDGLRWGDEWQGTLARDVKPGQAFLQHSPNLKLIGLPPYIVPVAFEAPRNLRRESREKGWRADRFILPYGVAGQAAPGKVTDQNWWLLPDIPLAKKGVYRPVWRVVVVDETGRRWLVLYDAETFEVLSWEPTQVAVTADALAYLQSTDIPSILSKVSLNFGAGSNSQSADRVRVSGVRQMEPVTPGTPGADDPQRVLTATTFYHTFDGQDRFTLALAGLTYNAGGAAPGADPLARIEVTLDNTDGTASYDYHTNTIHFRTGVTTGLTIAEPGFDPEVVIHEFTHAVLRYVNHRLFEYQANTKAETHTRGLDEGTAFYYGCSFAGGPRWADFAYAAWTPHRDLTPPPKGLSSVPSDPTGATYYRLGMWWARVFWELRAQPIHIQADGLVLNALTRLSGPVSDIRTIAYALLDPAELFGSNEVIAQVLTSTGALPAA